MFFFRTEHKIFQLETHRKNIKFNDFMKFYEFGGWKPFKSFDEKLWLN